MSGGSALIQPLPTAPVAAVPRGITAEGAARVAWQPNVMGWVVVWRVVVLALGAATLLLPAASRPAVPSMLVAGAWALLIGGISGRVHHPTARRLMLVIDALVCVGLLVAAPDRGTFSLLTLFACSTVVVWAAGKPVEAFTAAGVIAAASIAAATIGVAHAAIGASTVVSSVSLLMFFALATSGFFTVARRLGALEIATEISKERGRYRRDLHDRLGQALCGLHFELQAVHAGGIDSSTPGRLASLADGYRDAQSMLADLFRQGDEPMMATDVAAVVQQEARRLATQSGAEIDVVVSGVPARVPATMRPHVCAIAGECMTNALKNGEATRIDIDLAIEDELVILSVTDNGIGFDNPPGTLPEKVGHYGLREMAERARLCGGAVVVASQVGFGTRVRLQLPLPAGGGEEIIERDAGTLRRNVWGLLTVLRTGLGAVALAQSVTDAIMGGGSHWVGWALTLFMAADIVVAAVWRRQLLQRLTAQPTWFLAPMVAYMALAAACSAGGVTPVFMLYAPVLLLAVGVLGGRSFALRCALAWCAFTLGATLVIHATATLDVAAADVVVLYLTNLVIIGMSAVQGAALLDRLETLQIRVRYQTLARLRQGLSNRMRDELTERLAELEHDSRQLASHPPDAEEFSMQTQRLETGSSALKAKLREIVHQLADPIPGRTTAHV